MIMSKLPDLYKDKRSQGWFIFSLTFYCCAMTYRMFSKEKLPQAGQKNKVLVQNLFTQTDFTFLNINKTA